MSKPKKRQRKKNDSYESTSRRFGRSLQKYHNLVVGAGVATQAQMDQEMADLVDQWKRAKAAGAVLD